jgi:hypothetical protein
MKRKSHSRELGSISLGQAACGLVTRSSGGRTGFSGDSHSATTRRIKGVPEREIAEDFPNLGARDLAYARLFSRFGEKSGQPRK